MIMSINKKINDKNNSKLKTIQIINYEVKQSKMMFLFIFVLNLFLKLVGECPYKFVLLFPCRKGDDYERERQAAL